jgi:hypothetical protein
MWKNFSLMICCPRHWAFLPGKAQLRGRLLFWGAKEFPVLAGRADLCTKGLGRSAKDLSGAQKVNWRRKRLLTKNLSQ